MWVCLVHETQSFFLKVATCSLEAPEANVRLPTCQTCKMLTNRFKNSTLNTILSSQSVWTVSRKTLLSLNQFKCFSYLAGVGTISQTGAKHAVGDVVAIDFWTSASVMGDQSDYSLLQAGVTLGLCQIKHSTVMSWWIHDNIRRVPKNFKGQTVLALGDAAETRHLSASGPM